MALSNDLISQFVKVTQDKEETVKESTAYGKIVKQGDVEYVQLDGSEMLTPISSTTVVKDGDRVMVTIKNHTAVVTGDLTNPSASNKDVTEIGNKISEFEIIIADKVSTEQLEAEIAKIDKLVTDELKATNATIETLNTKVAEIDTIKADVLDVSGKVAANEAEVDTLKADIADFKDVTAESIEAIEGEFHNIESDYADFKNVTTNDLTAAKADIAELESKKIDTETANAKFANIDFSNIGEAAIEKLFSESGIIEDLIMSDGKVTGHLVGVTITGDLIEGNTVKADKLVIQGEDGLYYKLNVNALGEATAKSDPKYQNGLDGSIIVAESITAEKIAVDDLVAFGATIGGYHINNHALYSGTKNSISNTTRGAYLGDDGQLNIGDSNNFLKFYVDENGKYKLVIQADTIKLSSTGKTIEETIADAKPEISKEAEGTEIIVSDGVKVIDFKVDGKSTQATRSGKNIFNVADVESDGYTTILSVEESSFTLAGAWASRIMSIENVSKYFEPNTAYIATAKLTVLTRPTTLGNYNHNRILILYNGTESYNVLISDDKNNWEVNDVIEITSPFTTPADLTNFKMIAYNYHGNSDGSTAYYASGSFKIENLMIRKATETDATFEPYGVQPSSDYPSEIRSLGYVNLWDNTTAITNWREVQNLIPTETGFEYERGDDTGGRYFANKYELKQGQSYIFSITPNPDVMLYLYKDQVYGTTLVNGYNQILYYASTDMTVYATVIIGSVIQSTVVSNIQFEEGRTKHGYVPYGKYGIDVTRTGLNKYDYKDIATKHSNITYDEDGWITASYDNSAGNGIVYMNYFTNRIQLKPSTAYTVITEIKEVSGTGTLVSVSTHNNPVTTSQFTTNIFYYFNSMTNNSVQFHHTTSTDNANECWYALRTFLQFSAGQSGSITFRLSILEGTILKHNNFVYEPFISHSRVFALAEPLRSLPNGVTDEAYIQNGKLYAHRPVKNLIFNGNENWLKVNTFDNSEYIGFTYQPSDTFVDNTDPFGYMCDRFRCIGAIGWSTPIEHVVEMNDGRILITILREKLVSEDVSGFKTWLSENNTVFQYETQTPTTEYIGDLDIPMYKDEVNVYSVKDALAPNIYCRYFTKYAESVADIDTLNDQNLSDVTNALEQEIINQSTNILAQAEILILEAATEYVKTGDYDTFKSTVEAQLSLMSNEITMRFTSTTNDINDLRNLTSDELTIIKKYFQFNEDGVTIGSGESAIKLKVDNDDGIVFTKNGEVFGYWDGNDFYSGNIKVRVNERAQFGAYGYIPRSDKSLMFLKID